MTMYIMQKPASTKPCTRGRESKGQHETLHVRAPLTQGPAQSHARAAAAVT